MTQPAPGRRAAVLACAAATTLVAILLVPYAIAAATSVMMFDAPGASERAGLWAVFCGVLLLPLVEIALVVHAWVALGRARHRRARWSAAVAALLAVAPVLWLLGALLTSG